MKKYSFWIVVVLTAIASIYVYFQFLKPLDVFIWDESHHGFYGMQIYNDLKAGNFGAFWADTNSQAMWMPLHSWVDGAFLYLFGFSYIAARSSSLFLFFINSILIYLICLNLSKDKGWIIGILASCLYITSPYVMVLASMNMQETLGTCVLLLTVYFMTRSMMIETICKYLSIGFLLSVCYMTKLNYAVQTIAGVGLFQISLLFDIYKIRPVRGKKLKWNENPLIKWIKYNMLIIAGFLPITLLWWITPPFQRKYALGVTMWLNGSTLGISLYPMQGFLNICVFYFQSILTSYNFSLWLGIGCLAALLASFFYYKDRNIRLISLLFVADLFTLGFNKNIQERYVILAVPPAFLMLSYFCLVLFENIRKLTKYKAAAVYALIVLIMANVAFDLLQLTNYTRQAGNRAMMNIIYKDCLNKFSPTFMFGTIRRPRFTYPIEALKKHNDFKTTPRSSVYDALEFFSSDIDRTKSISTMISWEEISPYVIYWHFHDWSAPVMSVNDMAFNPRYFWMADYFLDIQASKDSPYYSDMIEKRWNDVSQILLRQGIIRLSGKKEFADLGLTARIYKREKNFYFK